MNKTLSKFMILILLMNIAISGKGDGKSSHPTEDPNQTEGQKPKVVDFADRDQTHKMPPKIADRLTMYGQGNKHRVVFGGIDVRQASQNPTQITFIKHGVKKEITPPTINVYNIGSRIGLTEKPTERPRGAVAHKGDTAVNDELGHKLTKMITARLGMKSLLSETVNYQLLMSIFKKIVEVIPECSADEVKYFSELLPELEMLIKKVTTLKTSDQRVVHFCSKGTAINAQTNCKKAKQKLQQFQSKSTKHPTNLFNSLISDFIRLDINLKSHDYIDNSVQWVVKEVQDTPEELAKHDYLRRKDGLEYKDDYSGRVESGLQGVRVEKRTEGTWISTTSMADYLVRQSESIISQLEGPDRLHLGYTIVSHIISIFSEIKEWASAHPDTVPKNTQSYRRLVEATINWVGSSPFVNLSYDNGSHRIQYLKSHTASLNALMDVTNEFVTEFQEKVEPLLPARNNFALRKRLRLITVQLTDYQLTLGVQDDFRLDFLSEKDRLFFMKDYTMDPYTKVLKPAVRERVVFINTREKSVRKDKLGSGRVYLFRSAKDRQQMVFIEFFKAFLNNLNLHFLKHSKQLAQKGLDPNIKKQFIEVRNQVVLRGKYLKGTKVVGYMSLPESAMRTLWKNLYLVESVTQSLRNDKHFEGDLKLLDNLSRSTLFFIDWTKAMFNNGNQYHEFNPKERISEYFPGCKVAEDNKGYTCEASEKGRTALVGKHRLEKEWMNSQVSKKNPVAKTRLFLRAFKVWKTCEPVLKNKNLPRNRLIPIARIINELPAVLKSQEVKRRKTGTKEPYSTVNLKKVSPLFKRTQEYLDNIFPDLDYQNLGQSEEDDTNVEELDDELRGMLRELQGAKQTNDLIVFKDESALKGEELESEDLELRDLDTNKLVESPERMEVDIFDENSNDSIDKVIEWSAEEELGEEVNGEENEGLVTEEPEDEEEEGEPLPADKSIKSKPNLLNPKHRTIPKKASQSESPTNGLNNEQMTEEPENEDEKEEPLPADKSIKSKPNVLNPKHRTIPKKPSQPPTNEVNNEQVIEGSPSVNPNTPIDEEEEEEPLPVDKFTKFRPGGLKQKQRTIPKKESQQPSNDLKKRGTFKDDVEVFEIPSIDDEKEEEPNREESIGQSKDLDEEDDEPLPTGKFAKLKPEKLSQKRRTIPQKTSQPESPIKEVIEGSPSVHQDIPVDEHEVPNLDDDLELEELPEESNGFKREEDDVPEEEANEPIKKRSHQHQGKTDDFSIKLIPTEQPDQEEDEDLPKGKFSNIKPEQMIPKRKSSVKSGDESPIKDNRRRVTFDDNVRVFDNPSSDEDEELGEDSEQEIHSPRNHQPSPKKTVEEPHSTPSSDPHIQSAGEHSKFQTDVVPSPNGSPKKEAGNHLNWGNALFLPSDPLWEEKFLNPTDEDPSIKRHINTIKTDDDYLKDSDDEEPIDGETIKGGESTHKSHPKIDFLKDEISGIKIPPQPKLIRQNAFEIPNDDESPSIKRNIGHNTLNLDNFGNIDDNDVPLKPKFIRQNAFEIPNDDESPSIKRNIGHNTLNLDNFADIDENEYPPQPKLIRKNAFIIPNDEESKPIETHKRLDRFRPAKLNLQDPAITDLIDEEGEPLEKGKRFESLRPSKLIRKNAFVIPNDEESKPLDKSKRFNRTRPPALNLKNLRDSYQQKLNPLVQPRLSIRDPNGFLIEENPIDQDRLIVPDEKWPSPEDIERRENLRNRVPGKSRFFKEPIKMDSEEPSSPSTPLTKPIDKARLIVPDKKWPSPADLEKRENLRKKVPGKSRFFKEPIGEEKPEDLEELEGRMKRIGKELNVDLLSDDESDQDEPMDEDELEMKLIQLQRLRDQPDQVEIVGKEKLISEIMKVKDQLDKIRRAKRNQVEDEKHPSVYPGIDSLLDRDRVPKKSRFFVNPSPKKDIEPKSPTSPSSGLTHPFSEFNEPYPDTLKRLASLKKSPGKSRFFYESQELKKLTDPHDHSLGIEKITEENDEVDPTDTLKNPQTGPHEQGVVGSHQPSGDSKVVGETEVAVAGEPRKKRIVHRVVFVVSECGKCVENPVLRRHFAALKIKMN
jgi:hypothetical protein